MGAGCAGSARLHDGDDAVRDVGRVLVLPEAEHRRPTFGGDGRGVGVALAVPGDLVRPVAVVRLRPRESWGQPCQ